MTALFGPDRDQLRQRLFSSVNIACQIENLPLTREQIGDIADYLLPAVEAHTEANTRAARADELEQLLPRLDDLSLPGDYTTFGQGWNGALNTLHGEIGSRAALRTHEGDTDGQ